MLPLEIRRRLPTPRPGRRRFRQLLRISVLALSPTVVVLRMCRHRAHGIKVSPWLVSACLPSVSHHLSHPLNKVLLAWLRLVHGCLASPVKLAMRPMVRHNKECLDCRASKIYQRILHEPCGRSRTLVPDLEAPILHLQPEVPLLKVVVRRLGHQLQGQLATTSTLQAVTAPMDV
jgi:hypothetical protein